MGGLFYANRVSGSVSAPCQRAPLAPLFLGTGHSPASLSDRGFLFFTYRIFNHLSFTFLPTPLLLGVDSSSPVPAPTPLYTSWLPASQQQFVVSPSLQLGGVLAALVQPQLFSQTSNVSSWLFLRGLHQLNATLPLSPAAQSADLWVFHRELRFFCSGAAVAYAKPSPLLTLKPFLRSTTLGSSFSFPGLFTFATPHSLRNFF
jgi:hypothetical protein